MLRRRTFAYKNFCQKNWNNFRTQNDWLAALELTNYLQQLDADDPVKYDYALFGLGVIEKY